MALTVKKPEGEFELAPQGTHVARCYSVVDMGNQQTNFGIKHKIRLMWELPNELMADGRPFVVGKEYTASLHPDANLTRDLVSWRGRAFTDEELAGFDVFKVAGAPCMVTVTHNKSNDGTKTYANVNTVTAIPKGMVCPDQVNPTAMFSLEEPDMEVYNALPQWLRDRINMGGAPVSQPAPASDPVTPKPGSLGAKAAAMAGRGVPPAASDDLDDDIPF